MTCDLIVVGMFKQITQKQKLETTSLRGRRVWREWTQSEPVLKGWNLSELANPSFNDPIRTDAMQAALVRLSQSGCETAALTLTCQLLPGLKKIAYTTARGFEDPAGEVISSFFEVLGKRDIEQRPTKVAANLILDTKQKVYRSLLKRMKQSEIQDLLAQSLEPKIDMPAMSRMWSVDHIRRALDTYPTKSQAELARIAFMHWVEGYTTNEIAEKLEISQTSITTKIWRLRNTIKAQAAVS